MEVGPILRIVSDDKIQNPMNFRLTIKKVFCDMNALTHNIIMYQIKIPGHLAAE